MSQFNHATAIPTGKYTVRIKKIPIALVVAALIGVIIWAQSTTLVNLGYVPLIGILYIAISDGEVVLGRRVAGLKIEASSLTAIYVNGREHQFPLSKLAFYEIDRIRRREIRGLTLYDRDHKVLLRIATSISDFDLLRQWFASYLTYKSHTP